MNAILYAAKSTTDERGSIPTQIADGRAMAEREGWEIAGEYSDEAASAWSGDRGPGLARAMEHAERIGAVLVVQHSDRLARGDGRSARHLGELYFWALKAGVELRSVQDDATFTNPLLAFAMGERNAEDSRRKSLAVAAGMKRRAEKGLPTGGPRPYGLRHVPDGYALVPDEAPIVRRIAAEFVSGRSQMAICRELNRDEIPTVFGGRWHGGTISQMLANPVYRGQVVHNGTIYPGRHEAIIDPATVEKIDELRESKRRTYGRGRPPAGSHLFRKGMLRCECGAAMIPRTDPNRASEPSEVYRCYGRHQDPGSCAMAPIRRELVDDAVYRYFERVGLDVEATRDALAEARDRKLAEVRALRHGAERDVRASEERLQRIRRDYTDGTLSATDWQDLRAELEPELAATTAKLERLVAQEADVTGWVDLQDAEAETLRHLAEIRAAIAGEITDAEGVEAVRAVLGRMFECFVLHRSTPERVHVELVGQPWIEPIPRGHALEGGDRMRPVLRREPLNHAADNLVDGLPTRSLFAPIPVGA